jgi:hypothetical protein
MLMDKPTVSTHGIPVAGYFQGRAVFNKTIATFCFSTFIIVIAF